MDRESCILENQLDCRGGESQSVLQHPGQDLGSGSLRSGWDLGNLGNSWKCTIVYQQPLSPLTASQRRMLSGTACFQQSPIWLFSKNVEKIHGECKGILHGQWQPSDTLLILTRRGMGSGLTLCLNVLLHPHRLLVKHRVSSGPPGITNCRG